MKLIVQIPCFNEEKTLPLTIRDIPRDIPGIDTVEILVIDDGSIDRTSEVARELGVDHIIRLSGNKGLARAFIVGLEKCLELGADIIVNTDGDNQYKGEDIQRLVEPILKNEADIVVGQRDIDNIPHFSRLKKKLQALGSWVIRTISRTNVPDATSGFRAYKREAAMKINMVSRYSYTLETIIQAGMEDMKICPIKIRTNEKLRESRLYTSMFNYLSNSINTIIRIYTMYRPLKVFFWTGGVIFFIGFLIGLRYLYLKYFIYTDSNPARHIQSLILMATLLIIGFQVMVIGLLSDLISSNRKLIQDLLYRIRKMEFKKEEK